MSSKTFDIADLSDNLADLLSDIQNHVEVTLTRQGVPWARVLPLSQPQEQPVVSKAGLPLYHKDPFDRMLISQALVEGLTLISIDKIFKLYEVPLFSGDFGIR